MLGITLNMDVLTAIHQFLNTVGNNDVEIYNEFSFQHELGLFLRQHIADHKIQFERNVSHFGFDKVNFEKKEIDIAVFKVPDTQRSCVIELKFPRNGQVPETMFSFCKDISFLEQLVNAGFDSGYFVALADDKNFYSGNKVDGIYGLFRDEQVITGAIVKPTGDKDTSVTINNTYIAKWFSVTAKLKCCIIEINK
jgi:hypothetical protein